MSLNIRRWGKVSLHVPLRKSDGWKEGEEVIVIKKSEWERINSETKKEFDYSELKQIVREAISEELASR